MATDVSRQGSAPLRGKTMMQAPLQGIEFLSASHFAISQDNAVTEPSLKSIFKKDYVPWEIGTRPPASVPPNPADVLHRDDRFFNEKASETVKAYQPKPLPTPEFRDTDNLRSTNFKMDRDLSKFDSFSTTHNLHYQPKYEPSSPDAPRRHLMESFIPQGDPAKAPQPVSDYRDRYRGHEAGKPYKAPSMHQGGDPTITGDGRLHQFGTTHNDHFRGVHLPKIQPFPAAPSQHPVGSNIPQGDKGKEMTVNTIQQQSFPMHDKSHLQGYDKNAVMGKLQRTNFTQNDGHQTWNNYRSTTSEAYQPVRGDMTRYLPDKHRNHSDFPEGDADPWRDAARSNMTTNRFYHGDVQTPKADIVSGANKRTKSNVWFGDPELDEKYYSTTTDSTFQPNSVKRRDATRPDFNTRSCVPVNYYPEDVHHATTWSDFQNPLSGKMIPDEVALDNLKKSHIRAPLGGERQFTTEHVEQYTPKYASRVGVDSGRLQRSTVPLGTMQV